MSETDEKIREMFLRSATAIFENYMAGCGHRFLSAESEIERLMTAAFMAQEMLSSFTYPTFVFYSGRPVEFKEAKDISAHTLGGEISGHRPDIIVWPQISIEKYRTDFVCFGWNQRAETCPLIVECDGHDFHEKTKDQAQRDKSRDRFFVSKNIPVMRFTGSEIWRDAPSCVKEIGRYYAQLFQPELYAA